LGYKNGTTNNNRGSVDLPEMFHHDLNFLAFGVFSPLNILSAPTFLPLLGQPDLGAKTLHELPPMRKQAKVTMKTN
jgi:hypothetical protein